MVHQNGTGTRGRIEWQQQNYGHMRLHLPAGLVQSKKWSWFFLFLNVMNMTSTVLCISVGPRPHRLETRVIIKILTILATQEPWLLFMRLSFFFFENKNPKWPTHTHSKKTFLKLLIIRILITITPKFSQDIFENIYIPVITYPGFQSMRSWANTYAKDCIYFQKYLVKTWVLL